MSRYKLTTTFLSAAALTACIPSTYYANDRDQLDIVCVKEAAISSHIKEETCDYTSREVQPDQPHDDDPFQVGPITPKRTVQQTPIGSDAPPPPPPEGNCGGAL